MLTKTKAYRDLEQAGYNPLVYVHLSTDVTRRIFTFKASAGVSEGSGYWDGSRYVGDGLTYGFFAGISAVEPLLLSVSQITQSTTQSTRNLLSALSAAAVGHVTITLDNTDLYFTNLVSGTTPEQFETYSVEIRQGFEGLAIGDQLSLFRGICIDTQLDNKTFTVSADSVSSTLYDVWECPKTARYTLPENNNAAIPLVLGDLTESSDAGVVVCPCINTASDVYALACHPILSVANGNTVTLYDSDGLISSSEYSVITSGDYESQGNIAYVTFSTPPNGAVSGKFKGAVNTSGALVTNPIECIELLLDLMDDPTTFEPTSFVAAREVATAEAYTCAGFIIADNTKAYWIGDIMASFLGSWFMAEDDEIVLQFDSSVENLMSAAGELSQEAATGISMKRTRDNIITRPIINYAISGAQIDRRYKNDALSNYYRTYSPEEVTGDITEQIAVNWTRNAVTVQTIADRIIALYGTPLNIYTWKEQGLENIQLEPGDFVAFEWDYILDSDGNPLTGEVGRLLNVTRDITKQSMSFTFYDTRNYLLALPYIWNGERYVGDGLTYGGERRTL